MKKLMTICVMAVMCITAVPSLGTVIQFTDEAVFQAALTPGYYLENFNYAPWLTVEDPAIPNTSFGPTNGWEYDISSPQGLSGQPTPAPDSGGAVAPYNGGQTLTVAFTGPLPTAVGGTFWVTNVSGTFVPGGVVTIKIFSDATYTYLDAVDYPAFSGFISNSPITSMTISTAGNWASMDNLYVGVPEPMTLGLLVIGGLALLIRKRK